MPYKPIVTERTEGKGINRRRVNTTQTGIFRHVHSESVESLAPLRSKKHRNAAMQRMKAIGDRLKQVPGLNDQLAGMERYAIEILQKHGLTYPWTKCKGPDGDPAPKTPEEWAQSKRGRAANVYHDAIKRTTSYEAKDADGLLWKIRCLRAELDKGQRGDATILAAIDVGMTWVRLSVRPFEPAAQAGQRSIDGGEIARKKRSAEGAEEHAKYQRCVDEYLQRNPTHSFEEAKRHAAEVHEVSARTITRHTQNPKKNKKS